MDPIVDQRLLTRFQMVSSTLAGLVAVLGVLVLFGWALDIQIIKGVIPGIGTTMKPNTAVGFLFSGMALSLVTATRKPWSRRAIQLLALGVLFIGAFTLLEYATGWNLRIDELLFLERLSPPAAMPGRMSPVTAAAFALAGIALIFIDGENRAGFLIAQFQAVLVGVAAFLICTGYLYGVTALY